MCWSSTTLGMVLVKCHKDSPRLIGVFQTVNGLHTPTPLRACAYNNKQKFKNKYKLQIYTKQREEHQEKEQEQDKQPQQ